VGAWLSGLNRGI